MIQADYTNEIARTATLSHKIIVYSPTFDQIPTNTIRFINVSIYYTIKAINTLTSALRENLNKLNRFRNKRCDRLKTICAITIAMLNRLELASFKIGKFDEDGLFISALMFKELAAETGFTYHEVEMAIADMRACGYLETKPWCRTTETGKIEGVCALKGFTNKFFIDIGIKESWINKIKSWKQKQLRKIANRLKNVNPKSLLGRALNLYIRPDLSQKEKDIQAAVTALMKKHRGLSLIDATMILMRLKPEPPPPK